MKKFSLTILCAATICSAAAADLNFRGIELQESIPSFNQRLRTPYAQDFSSPQKMVQPTRTPDIDYLNISDWQDVGQGTFLDVILGPIYNTTGSLNLVNISESKSNKGVYKIENCYADVFGDGNPSQLIIDASDPDYVIIPYQPTGLRDKTDGPVYVASMMWVGENLHGYSKEDCMKQYPEMLIYEDNKVIYFPPISVWLQWPDAPSSSSIQANEWYASTEEERGYLALPGGTPKDLWHTISTAKMVDNFVSGFFGMESDTPFEVDIQEYTLRPGVYRILNPWQNVANGLKELEFDAYDVNKITVSMQSTGYFDEKEGEYLISSFSNIASEERMKQKGYKYPTWVGNRITFPHMSLYVFKPDFDMNHLYVSPVEKDTWIEVDDMTAVETIEMEAIPECPAEYYNLQGIRVATPQKGRIYIMRQGDKTSKVVM